MAEETVTVIYEGANRRGFATRPGEAIYFIPGVNHVPKGQWDTLMKDKDPGGVRHFLKNRQMRLADDSAQDGAVMGDMTIHAAEEMIENAMTEGQLKDYRIQEDQRKRGPRKGVMDALDERQGLFDKVREAEEEEKRRLENKEME